MKTKRLPNASRFAKLLGFGSATLCLVACGIISERMKTAPVKRVNVLTPADQACDAPEQSQERVSGSYLRQSDASGLTFEPVLITGRKNRNGLRPDFTLNDQSQTREAADGKGIVFEGPKGGTAVERVGFGKPGALPNVYDVGYSTKNTNYSGPLVAGPGSFTLEIPTSGATIYGGRVALELITQNASGEAQIVRSVGRFTMQAGYGTARGSFTASGFDTALPFDTLSWTNLFLCGTRFVSSGKGVVTVQKNGGASLSPFKTDRSPAAFNALFEASQFAPVERPAPPVAVGGVFVIQSDNGTMTAVFLSDRVASQEPEDA